MKPKVPTKQKTRRMNYSKQPWKAFIMHKDRGINLSFPDECIVTGETASDLICKLSKIPKAAYYGIDQILIERDYREKYLNLQRRLRKEREKNNKKLLANV